MPEETDAQRTLQNFVGSENDATTQPSEPTQSEQDKAILEAFTGQVSAPPPPDESGGDSAIAPPPPPSEEEDSNDDEEQVDTRGASRRIVENAIQNLRGLSNGIGQGVANVPTVGSIGFLLFVILFLAVVIVPVNKQGDTRLKLLFYSLLDRTQLEGERNRETGQTVDTAAFDSFAQNLANVDATVATDIGSFFNGGFTR